MKVCFFMLGAVFGLEMTRPLSAEEVNKCTDLNCLSDIVQDGKSTVSVQRSVLGSVHGPKIGQIIDALIQNLFSIST